MIVNNRETYPDDHVFYVDVNKIIHEAVIENLEEQDGEWYAGLTYTEDDKKFIVGDVPYNTSVEDHSWNHPMTAEERETHYHLNFYG